MNTPTHFLTVAALDKLLKKKLTLFHQPLLIGSIAPDIPLYFLCLGAWVYYHFFKGWELGRIFDYVFNDLFFKNPVWITLHNFPHSPLVLIITIASVWSFRDQVGTWQRWIFWFAWGCLLHTALDIPTHVDDGPLLLFPLNWSWRFASPISYWDPRYHGATVARVESALAIVLALYLVIPWVLTQLRHWHSKNN